VRVLAGGPATRGVLIAALVLCLTISGSGRAAPDRRAHAPALHTGIHLQPCDVPGIPDEGRCGTYDVYENRTAGSGRKIPLNIVVMPALGTPRAPDPVFWLEGGPGGAATEAIGPVSRNYLRGLRQDRDLVFVDQRGTGESNPLKCGDIGDDPANLDGFFGKLFPVPQIRACREQLERLADLTRYSTTVAADDLDEVRAALGYDRINLAGASYGTLAAQIYIRQHPEHARAAFLVGVATPGFRLPLPFARASQNAWTRLLADCGADPACRGAFPNLAGEFEAVLARFDHGAMQVAMIDPATRKPRPVTLEREAFVEHVRLMLYSTFAARFLPIVVHQAFLGDFLPFQTMAVRFDPGGALARGMYFSVTCSEDVPFITEQDIAAETRGTFLGDRRVRAHLAACTEWPRADVPRAFTDPVKSDVPVVMYSGEADGATPPWIAEEAVRFFTSGRQIRVPHAGHQIDGPCAWDLMQTFLRNPSGGPLDAACVGGIRRPAFATEVPR
jgi:pimeloyl-ACP methyl ester carboxylesterase